MGGIGRGRPYRLLPSGITFAYNSPRTWKRGAVRCPDRCRSSKSQLISEVDRAALKTIIGSFFTAAVLAGAGLGLAQTPPPPLAQTPPPVQGSTGKVVLLSLEDALRIGSGESEAVWVAEAGAMRSIGSEIVSRSTFFPQVSGTASYTRTLRSQYDGLFTSSAGGQGNGLSQLPFGQKNQYSLGLSLSQFIFDGGQALARLRAAEARRRSSEINVDSARAEALLDVTSTYFDALLADRLVEIAEASLAQQEEILRQTDVAFKVGDKSEFEQLQSRVSRDNQVPLVLQNRSRRQEAYLRLKQLLNVPLDDGIRLTSTLEELPARFAKLSDLTADARAPVRQAAEELQANQSLLAGAKAERWPSISLSSLYNPVAYPAGNSLPVYNDFRENWTVTLNLTIPLLTGGRLAGDELVARGNLSQAKAQLKQAREAAELDVRTSQLDLGDAEALLKSNQSTVESAKRGYEIAQLRFREGLSSQIELQNSRLLFEQAEVNSSQALRNVQVARARLALIRDLPLTQAGSQAAAQASGASTGSAGSAAAGTTSMTQPTSATGTSSTGAPGQPPGTGGTTP
jgi:outer membrane protein